MHELFGIHDHFTTQLDIKTTGQVQSRQEHPPLLSCGAKKQKLLEMRVDEMAPDRLRADDSGSV